MRAQAHPIRAIKHYFRIAAARTLRRIFPDLISLSNAIEAEKAERAVYAAFNEPYPFHSVLEMPPAGRVADGGEVTSEFQNHSEPTILCTGEMVYPGADSRTRQFSLQGHAKHCSVSVTEEQVDLSNTLQFLAQADGKSGTGFIISHDDQKSAVDSHLQVPVAGVNTATVPQAGDRVIASPAQGLV